MKNWLTVKWSLFWGWSLILKIGEKKSVNDPYQKSAKRASFAKYHDPYKKNECKNVWHQKVIVATFLGIAQKWS